MDEKRYDAIADATLMHCFDQLEPSYDAAKLAELELADGILTITTQDVRTFLLNKHAPSMQLWLASPISGGLHFRFDEGEQRWHLPDGVKLYDLLRRELAAHGVEVVL